MAGKSERLLYVDPKYRVRDSIDKGMDSLLLRTVKEIETWGSEENIPRNGKLVLGFAPHNGWLEVIVIDHFLRKIRGDRRGAVWITKKENEADLPVWITGNRRFIYVEREFPKPATIRTIDRVLNEEGIAASAFEGTRYGTGDRKGGDILSLGEFKPGLVYFASRCNALILPVVVLGADKVLPSPEKIREKYGIKGVLRELAKKIIMGDDRIEVLFLPAYGGHLYKEDPTLKRDEFLQYHTQVISREVVSEITRLNPQYPLGYYLG